MSCEPSMEQALEFAQMETIWMVPWLPLLEHWTVVNDEWIQRLFCFKIDFMGKLAVMAAVFIMDWSWLVELLYLAKEFLY